MVGQKSKTRSKIQTEARYGRFKSRQGLRMLYVKVPGGRTVIHFERQAPSKAQCAGCGRVLAGVAREHSCKMQNLPKTMKRPERPYGGYYCTKCSRKVIKAKARGMQNV